jgi:hypothetical protein
MVDTFFMGRLPPGHLDDATEVLMRLCGFELPAVDAAIAIKQPF